MASSQNVLTECLFLKNYSKGKDRIPTYNKHETINTRRFLIMTYFEESLEEHICKRVGQGERLDRILMDVAGQMIDCIR